jgi:hypothetical protein
VATEAELESHVQHEVNEISIMTSLQLVQMCTLCETSTQTELQVQGNTLFQKPNDQVLSSLPQCMFTKYRWTKLSACVSQTQLPGKHVIASGDCMCPSNAATPKTFTQPLEFLFSLRPKVRHNNCRFCPVTVLFSLPIAIEWLSAYVRSMHQLQKHVPSRCNFVSLSRIT